MLADMEDALYRETLQEYDELPPVSITALPRAGTTTVLQLLWHTGAFASHLYRDVPLVLTPMFWQQFRERFAVEPIAQERPHGDGITIDAESPEAFEEMVWKAFWPHHYRGSHIEPWRAHERADSFDAFFRRHRRKIIRLREAEYGGTRRYLAKNNGHIARLAHPPQVLREGTIVIMIREPLAHAASLLEQHRHLSALQETNPFLRTYMAGVAHHDFGQTLKPINVAGWLNDERDKPDSLTFWLRYWVAAYRTVLSALPDNALLCSYERLYREPERTLARLEESLELERDTLKGQASLLHEPREHSINEDVLPDELLGDASALHEELLRRAL
jgi:hypothetical protein